MAAAIDQQLLVQIDHAQMAAARALERGDCEEALKETLRMVGFFATALTVSIYRDGFSPRVANEALDAHDRVRRVLLRALRERCCTGGGPPAPAPARRGGVTLQGFGQGKGRTVKLGDILPEEALREMEKMDRRGTLTLSGLRTLFGKHRDALAAKGVDADYLAYVVAYRLGILR